MTVEKDAHLGLNHEGFCLVFAQGFEPLAGEPGTAQSKSTFVDWPGGKAVLMGAIGMSANESEEIDSTFGMRFQPLSGGEVLSYRALTSGDNGGVIQNGTDPSRDFYYSFDLPPGRFEFIQNGLGGVKFTIYLGLYLIK